jgi:ATP-dependent DNA helicase RecG
LGEKVGDRVGEKVGEKLTENQKKIIEDILHTPNISARELSAIIGISQRKIEQNISRLKISGLLKRIGSAKGGYWEVIEKG